MKLEDLHLDEQFCQCHGKGDKQRLVPLSDTAVEVVATYLDTERPELAESAAALPDWVILSRSGRRFRREAIWELVKKYAAPIQPPIYKVEEGFRQRTE